MVILDSEELGKNKIGKLVTSGLCERYVDEDLRMGTIFENNCVLFELFSKVIQCKRGS